MVAFMASSAAMRWGPAPARPPITPIERILGVKSYKLVNHGIQVRYDDALGIAHAGADEFGQPTRSTPSAGTDGLGGRGGDLRPQRERPPFS